MIGRLLWFWRCDRLGPDIPLTHILLYFHKSERYICRKKFKKFGKNSEFRPFAFAHCPSLISIGDNVKIHPGTVLSASRILHNGTILEIGITIEDHVGIGHDVHFYPINHRHNRTDLPIERQGFETKGEIVVKRGAWIGAKSVILSGVTVGENAVVGAGSVVTKNVAPYTLVAGNPARFIKAIGE